MCISFNLNARHIIVHTFAFVKIIFRSFVTFLLFSLSFLVVSGNQRLFNDDGNKYRYTRNSTHTFIHIH